MKTSKLYTGILIIGMIITPATMSAGLVQGFLKACGVKEDNVLMDIARTADKVGNSFIAKKTNDVINKYGGEQNTGSYNQWAQQYTDNNTNITETLLNAVNLSMNDVNRAEQWINSSKFGKQAMIADEAFDIIGNHSSNRTMVEAFHGMTRANLEYVDAKSRGGADRDAALQKIALDYKDIIFDVYQDAEDRKRRYVSQKLKIKNELIASGFEGDSDFAMEIAGSILSVQNNKNLTEHEKHEWLRMLGYYGKEELVEQIVEQVDAMDDAAIDAFLEEAKKSEIDYAAIEAQKKPNRRL